MSESVAALKRSPKQLVAPTRGDLMVQFLQTLKVPDGPNAGRLIELRDWQITMIKSIYDPQREHLTPEGRRVLIRATRQAIVTIGRKNGKTSLAAGLLLGHLVGPEATWNAQLYSAAYEREQAALLYRAAASMVRMDSELTGVCRCTDSLKTISSAVNNSTYKALSAEARSKHGQNAAFVVFDELAQFHTDRELYDVLMTSMGAQLEPLMLVISTQASDDNAVLSQLIDYGREVNSGAVVDPSYVLIEYSTPSDAELAKVGKTIWDEDVWALANPALGDFRSIDEMRATAVKARRMPSLELTFRNLYLNQRTALRASFVAPSVWALGARTRGREALAGRPAYFALDLSSRLDLTALAIAVYVEEDDSYELIVHAFTPEETLEERETRDRAPYRDWVARGVLHAVPGKSVNYSHVVKVLAAEWQQFDARALAYDRWRMDVFKQALQDEDFVIPEEQFVAFGQGYKDMSPALEQFEELLVSERLAHGDNPILKWAIANAVVEKDAAGNKKLTKAKSYGRIDPAVAAVMAIGVATNTAETSAFGLDHF